MIDERLIGERLIGERFRALASELSERGRRIWAASEARALGHGGISAVSRASGISPSTIRKGIREGTSKSVRHLAAELRKQGHEAHHTTVAALLRSLGYSLQSNPKGLEGAQHPDRDAQFGLINERVAAAIAAGQPAISIDTKKKELVGELQTGAASGAPAGSRSRS